jgi:hypothetical protein
MAYKQAEEIITNAQPARRDPTSANEYVEDILPIWRPIFTQPGHRHQNREQMKGR